VDRYTCNVQSLQEKTYRVSNRGQLSFPASARHRWGIIDGGDVEVFDLGDAVVVLPGGSGTTRKTLASALSAERYAKYVSQIEDPDLRNE
jgi:bifunctional DNA-binding transcriptional regulator/antitoxin component of YhaV-PrlF toxin-antitoxin module